MIETFAELGEGIYVDKSSNAIYWVDINNNILFIKTYEKVNSFKFQIKISAVLYVRENIIHIASSDGIMLFDITSCSHNILGKTPYPFSLENYRSNDAIMISDGLYIYGIMDKNVDMAGAIIVSKKEQSYVVDDDIYIPNTFIKMPFSNDLLISDSKHGKIFRYQFSKDWDVVLNKSIWLDLSSEQLIPDGGCISSNNRIFIAIWDGFKIIELDLDGNLLNEFMVPVPRPTNCALNIDEDKLFVTSAYEGLTSKVRNKYPNSGMMVEVNI